MPDRAAVYYHGYLFDILIEPKDETKALAIFNRFLRNSSTTQPPERIARYAFLPANTESSRRSDGAIHKSGGNVCPGRPRRRCIVLLGTNCTD